MNREDKNVYEFGEFRLEGAQGRLLQNGQPVALKPKILDLLLFLVQQRGQLVKKDDLMREIWPNTIVEENNITVSISALRKVLGEDTGRQFIETVPRRGYRFVADVIEIADQEADSGELPIDSLAILPMQNPTYDETAEYLSEGITESIVNRLSQIPKLRVLACSTVFRFKGKDVNPQEVGLRLRVRAVMLVRVIQLGEKLVIRSELVKVSDGSQIWGDQYDRSSDDLLAIQGEIAKAISESLKIKLSQQELVRLTKPVTDNTEAFHL